MHPGAESAEGRPLAAHAASRKRRRRDARPGGRLPCVQAVSGVPVHAEFPFGLRPGERIDIAASKTPSFKAGKALRDAVR